MIRIHQRVARLSWKHWGVCLTRLNWITGDHYDHDHDCHDCDDGNHDYRDDHEGVVIMVIMIIIMNWVNLWQTSFGLSCLVFLPHFFLSLSFPSFFSFLNIFSLQPSSRENGWVEGDVETAGLHHDHDIYHHHYNYHPDHDHDHDLLLHHFLLGAGGWGGNWWKVK